MRLQKGPVEGNTATGCRVGGASAQSCGALATLGRPLRPATDPESAGLRSLRAGGQGGASNLTKDHQKRRRLEAAGFRVERVTYDELHYDTAALAAFLSSLFALELT
jgi:hypothetical protein